MRAALDAARRRASHRRTGLRRLSVSTPEPSIDTYRRAVAEMLDGFESLTKVEVRAEDRRAAMLIYGWVAHVHELGRAIVLLCENNSGHAAQHLVRAALEYAVTAHWLSKSGDDGVDAFLGRHVHSFSTLAEDAQGGPIVLSNEFLESLGKFEFEANPDDRVARRFINMCADLGVSNTIYASYRLVSNALHPGFMTSAMYGADDGTSYLKTSKLSGEESSAAVLPLLSHSLVWAGGTLDSIMIGHPRKEELERIADAIHCPPTLPDRVG